MPKKHVAHAEVKRVVEEATELLGQVEDLLEPYLVLLTEKERKKIPKPRDGFEKAGRALARAVKGFPKVADVSGCNPVELVDNLDSAKAMAPLAERTAALSRRIADARLTWLAAAWLPALTAYGIAKVLSKTDAALRAVVDPLAPVFVVRRRKPAKK